MIVHFQSYVFRSLTYILTAARTTNFLNSSSGMRGSGIVVPDEDEVVHVECDERGEIGWLKWNSKIASYIMVNLWTSALLAGLLRNTLKLLGSQDN